jgi:hypothetical protein
MAITYRLVQGSPLTLEQMDDNFRSLYFSSSVEDQGSSLRLYFDTIPLSYHSIPLTGASGSLSISPGNVQYRLLTATGTNAIQGESNLLISGSTLILTGSLNLTSGPGEYNIFIGQDSGDFSTGFYNIGLGVDAAKSLTSNFNTAVGNSALPLATTSEYTLALGYQSLSTLTTGNNNTALGAKAGTNLSSGAGNVYLGQAAGPSTSTAESNKLYIHNAASSTPLIKGDFSTGHITVSSAVSASIFSGSFRGDGSLLTGLTAAAEWDGTRAGDAEITGSLIVSGSNVKVDFTKTSAISGSIFSGSFVGNGAGLTGVLSEWDGTRAGDAEVTGSFIVSGSNPTIDLKGAVTIQDSIKIHSPASQTIAIGANTVNTSSYTSIIAIGENTVANPVGSQIISIGYNAGTTAGGDTIYIGNTAGNTNTVSDNLVIGHYALYESTVGAGNNTILGHKNLYSLISGSNNVSVGNKSVSALEQGYGNTTIGTELLPALINGNNNTAIGHNAGSTLLLAGDGNVYLGTDAGSPTVVTENSQLYISNYATDTPLIKGDFSTGHITVNSTVSASVFSGSYVGNGSQLTSITGSWNGVRDGGATITGSLIVTSQISSSLFSGSFVGDGAGITGVVSTGWNGIRSGSAGITGSLTVISGSTSVGTLVVGNAITLSTGSVLTAPLIEVFQYYTSSLSGVNTLITLPISSSAGYSGIKADYVLTTPNELEKRVGTLLATWDRIGNSNISDTAVAPTGDAIVSKFSIDASSTTSAILKVDAVGGNFEVNMVVTAFKRSV